MMVWRTRRSDSE
jgi:cytochrome P450 family 4